MKGETVRAAGCFTNVGDSQVSDNVLRIITTDATSTLIGLEGFAQAPLMPISTSWFYTAKIVARRTDVEGDTACFEIKGLCFKNATGSVIGVGTPTVIKMFSTSGATTWNVEATYGTSSLNIKGVGEVGKTIRWVENLELLEVSN